MRMSKMACLGALLLMPFLGMAQEIDLWDTWRQGFEKYEAAEAAFKNKKMDTALKLYKESHEIFQKIRKASPDWNKDVVAYRISLCDRKIKTIKVPVRRPVVVEKPRRDELAKLNREIEALKKQLRQTRIELIDAKNAADRNALSEKQIKKLMSENSVLEKKIAAQGATISSLKADLVRADKSQQYQKQLLQAKTDIEKINQDKERLKKDLEAMKKRSQKYQDLRNKAESKLFRLEKQLAELNERKKEIEVLSAENKKLAGALNQASDKLKEADRKIESIQKSNAALHDKITDLESGKIVLSSEKKLRDDLSAEKSASAAVKASLEKANKENQKLLADLEKLRAENRKIVLDLVKTTENVAKARNENNEMQKKLDELNRQLATSKVLAAENAELKKNIREVSKKYEESREVAEKVLSAKVKELTTELENAKVRNNYMSERLRRTEEGMKGASSRMQQTITKLEEEKAIMRQSSVMTKHELSKVKSALEKLTIEYDALKKEFDALNAKAAKAPEKKVETEKKVVIEKKIVVEKVPVIEKKVVIEKVPVVEKKTVVEKVPAVEKGMTPAVAINKEMEAKLAKLSGEIKRLTGELDRLKRENANYRIQLSAYDKVVEENKELRSGQVTANKKLAENEAARIANLEKIRSLNSKLAELEAAVKTARETISNKDAVIAANAKQLNESVSLLKKQLIAAQNAEVKVRKELELLKMEYSDLEKKLANTVSSDSLKTVKGEVQRLIKDIAELRRAKAETEASLKASEDLVKLQNKRLAEYAKEINPDAKNQISKLTAAVAELQEAKIQYEFLLRELRERVKTLNEDNKELKQANIALRVASAELKVKPAEYQKTIADLQQKNENLRNLNKTSAEQNIKLTEKTKADAKKIENLCKEIDAANLLVQRYRKELNEWGELPKVNSAEEIAKKNQAIDSLVQETDELRKERDMLKTELTLSKDHVIKYKRLAKDIEANLQMTRSVLARVQNALARHTSAVEVEKLVAQQYEFKRGEFGPVASIDEVQKEVAKIKDEETPKFSAEEAAQREKEYKALMQKGLQAERKKDYSEALAQYWRATSFCADGAEVQKALARVYLARRDFVNARDHYRTAVLKHKLKRDPDFEEKLIALAQELAAEQNDKAKKLKK
ncbi:MAG: hypothetical protein E7040_06870 [Lentisphaerae bacterium]|nr:hypothetical protein [Lentisphaerota bacterium]